MKKILIVDDSETMRAQLKRDLETKGFSVIEATDGIHGLDVLGKHPDTKLVITDVNMPRLDGLDMAKKMRSSPASQTLPILVMTTEVNTALKAKAKEAGVLAWIMKPYSAEKLVPVIEKILK